MAIKSASAKLLPPKINQPNMTFEQYCQLSGAERNQVNRQRRAQGLKPYNANLGRPNPGKGVPRPHARGPRPHMQGVPKLNCRGPRPHIWVTGPDEQTHEHYYLYLKQKAQAMFRQEAWSLTFDEWQAVWAGRVDQRGRSSQSLCMTMTDPDVGWCMGNVEILTRREHLQRQVAYRTAIRRAG